MAMRVGGGVVRALGLCAALLVGACAGQTTVSGMRDPAHRPSLDQVAPDFRSLAGWAEDDHSQAVPALHRTCWWVDRQPAEKPMGDHPAAGLVGDWRPVCAAARALPAGDPEASRVFFETHFRPVSLTAAEDGLFTGYYEPMLRGSWTRTERFNVPIYRMPARGKNGLPSRGRIAAGALAGRGLELLWVDDAIDAFFLEIQGSGRVQMTDGTVIGLGYAGQNGHSYFPIGRYLIDQGYATREEMSLQFIRQWLHANPGEARRVTNLNPSYVFFKIRTEGEPRGARGMELTAGRSLAVDPDFVPLGPPLWLELKEAPVPGGEIRRLVLAQDTGGAIKGAVRGDLFWGSGSEAEAGAGTMKARGRYTMLVPRATTVQTAQRR